MTQDPPKPKPEILVTLDGGSLAVWRSVALLKSPAFQAMSLAAHKALAVIEVEKARGQSFITHRTFIAFGVNRGSVTYAIAQLEALGVIRVERHEPRANFFAMSDRWREISSVAEAKAIAARATNFGLLRRRRVERATASRKRHHQEEDQHHDDNEGCIGRHGDRARLSRALTAGKKGTGNHLE